GVEPACIALDRLLAPVRLPSTTLRSDPSELLAARPIPSPEITSSPCLQRGKGSPHPSPVCAPLVRVRAPPAAVRSEPNLRRRRRAPHGQALQHRSTRSVTGASCT